MIIEVYRFFGFVGEVYMFKNRKFCVLKQVFLDIRDMMKLERVVLYSDKMECVFICIFDIFKVDCLKLYLCFYLCLQVNMKLLKLKVIVMFQVFLIYG